MTGFEITTNKDKVHKLGYEVDDSLMRIPELLAGEQVIVEFEICLDEKVVATGSACYYLSKNKYSTVSHTRLIYLKIKLQDEEFIKKSLKKVQ